MKTVASIAISALALCLAACSNEDDINAIFVGKTWQITSATTEGETLNGEEIKELYAHTGAYYLIFTASTFTGALVSGSSIAGKWSADGDTRALRLNFTTAQQVSASDVSKTIYDILSNATAYAGDENTLYIKQDSRNYVLLSSSTAQ